MKHFILLSWLLVSFLIMRNEALAGPGLCRVNAIAPTFAEGKDVPCSIDSNGSIRLKDTSDRPGEDGPNDLRKVEQRFSPTGNILGDTLIKSSPGFLHGLTCVSDATATAGTIILYDNSAESGTIIFSMTVNAVEYKPFTLLFDVVFNVGLYVGYTTTNDMNCTVAWR